MPCSIIFYNTVVPNIIGKSMKLNKKNVKYLKKKFFTKIVNMQFDGCNILYYKANFQENNEANNFFSTKMKSIVKL